MKPTNTGGGLTKDLFNLLDRHSIFDRVVFLLEGARVWRKRQGPHDKEPGPPKIEKHPCQHDGSPNLFSANRLRSLAWVYRAPAQLDDFTSVS
jgi:hypothetical protein